MSEPTFWNGEPTPARRVTIEVAGDGRHPEYWARDLVGTRRNAVEVEYPPARSPAVKFYLDDEPHEPSEEKRRAYEQMIARLPEQMRASFPDAPTVGYDGWGWAKVTKGRGSPRLGHRNLAVVPGSVRPRDSYLAECECGAESLDPDQHAETCPALRRIAPLDYVPSRLRART